MPDVHRDVASSSMHSANPKGKLSAKKISVTIPPLGNMNPLLYEEANPGPPSPLCGPKALKVVCDYLGVKADAEQLAVAAGTDYTGTSLWGLKKAAESKGLKADGLQADLAYLTNAKKPVIAWVGHDHYIVVTRIRSGKVELIDDPDKGRMDMNIADFMKIWDGRILKVRRT